MLHSDFPYTSHKAHNGAAKSVKERLSFLTEEQTHRRTLPVHFTENSRARREEREVFCHKLFGLKLCTVLCDRIHALLGVHTKPGSRLINKSDVVPAV